MPRGKELSPSLRSRICELRRQVLTHSQIKKQYPEIPLGTIKTTLRREAQRGADNASRPRSGAPRKLTEEQRDQIYDTITTDPHVTMRDLLESVDNAVKLRSLGYLLREMNKRKWMQKKTRGSNAATGTQKAHLGHTISGYRLAKGQME
ncbi:hypothetical protein QSH57_004631 [Fusarium oxysporum f. sp. vasinfectum]|nr:hypothetical protein QSH57_004631 [Fusarium oxysporum f. sp. vasinfectum]